MPQDTCSTTASRCSPLSKGENATVFQKTLGVNDFYFSGGEDFDFLGNIQMIGKSQAPMFHGETPGETRFAPTWSLEDVAKPAVDFWLSTEDLSRPGCSRSRPRALFTVHARLPVRSAPKHAVLFYNPKSGGGKAERFEVAREARARGVEPV
ncbi:MAG: hypothetical protein ACXVII_46210, partial [Solirubrobacteraceae bacterium]